MTRAVRHSEFLLDLLLHDSVFGWLTVLAAPSLPHTELTHSLPVNLFLSLPGLFSELVILQTFGTCACLIIFISVLFVIYESGAFTLPVKNKTVTDLSLMMKKNMSVFPLSALSFLGLFNSLQALEHTLTDQLLFSPI